MKKTLITAAMMTVALCGAVPAALAGDADLCLDCHEPADDWEGMSREQVFTDARDPDIKRHEDNQDLSDEQLKVVITELLPE